ncbi:SRPBCC domain-containing protein [Psychrobacillus sp. FJAT-21963]|uniref:SRPBCC family protein n=1 Tax=Psychrobacillus sp. FJAT-21963 TaxID=1712028 RepID=UPI0006F304C3|nr:SRPBCC domain-containing protein [Psychrobacillus sp. FJAT-21963]KQL33655.1 ATPase [Psychrobacillus sp. FJAT-21963]
MDLRRIVGQTKTAGFQVGVRRTFPISQEKAWELITSEEGLKLWLGESTNVFLKPSQKFVTKTVTGQIRVVKTQQQLRLTWQKVEWLKPSIVQIRFIPRDSNKTTISFHQENLNDSITREKMKVYWEKVLDEVRERIPNFT